MTFHFLGNHLVGGGEAAAFGASLVLLVAGILAFFFVKKDGGGVAFICVIAAFIALVLGMWGSGDHYDDWFVKSQLKADGLKVISNDSTNNVVTVKNGGCELVLHYAYQDGTVFAYVRVRDDLNLIITSEGVAKMCAAAG